MLCMEILFLESIYPEFLPECRNLADCMQTFSMCELAAFLPQKRKSHRDEHAGCKRNPNLYIEYLVRCFVWKPKMRIKWILELETSVFNFYLNISWIALSCPLKLVGMKIGELISANCWNVVIFLSIWYMQSKTSPVHNAVMKRALVNKMPKNHLSSLCRIWSVPPAMKATMVSMNVENRPSRRSLSLRRMKQRMLAAKITNSTNKPAAIWMDSGTMNISSWRLKSLP